MELKKAIYDATSSDDSQVVAQAYKNDVMEKMANLRAPIDALEKEIPKNMWHVPTYGDMIFDS